MLPVDAGRGAATDQGEVWHRDAHTDRGDVSPAVGIYSAAACQAGNRAKAGSGSALAERGVSRHPHQGEEGRRGDLLG